MFKCLYCGKSIDPEWHIDCLVISIDGDMVCNQQCYKEYQKQKDKFYKEIVPHKEKFCAWILGHEV